MQLTILGLAASYLIGSIPTAYIFVRLLKGVDVRKVGSGNVGATNASRILGKKLGILVLLLDILKGFVVVFFLSDFLAPRVSLISTDALRVILGFVAICGHNWTIFLNFKGGKGVATTLGVLAGLAFKIPGINIALGLILLSWLIVFIISRIVSLASIVGALLFPIFVLIFNHSVFMFIIAIILAAFIILRHKSNIQRLLQGKESRINFRK
ncbi:MAG: glycerol-3-phosphate 1-O-acyltransferase PlsY [Candidatus Omnitrophota bacterium]